MKYFDCADVVPGCDVVFRGLDEGGIVLRAAEHAATAHGLSNVDDQIASAIR